MFIAVSQDGVQLFWKCDSVINFFFRGGLDNRLFKLPVIFIIVPVNDIYVISSYSIFSR